VQEHASAYRSSRVSPLDLFEQPATEVRNLLDFYTVQYRLVAWQLIFGFVILFRIRKFQVGIVYRSRGEPVGAKAQERTIQYRAWCLVQGSQFSRKLATALKWQDRYKPLAHCFRSGGLTA
jgi:hypothetical protein